MQNYLDAWSSLDFVRYFTNTLKSSVITTILTVIASATCGFAFAKYDMKWLKFFLSALLQQRCYLPK